MVREFLGSVRGSRAAERVLAIANFCRVYLTAPGLRVTKDCFGATPKRAREPRALRRQPLAARVPFLN
ncbi:MAG: hypothetical protein DMC59_06555 [Verrucomicrobia bacterium]|nr:MAG: hypothetical protein DMC59_06555 [Verrucomicrobiota bacterium]